MEQFLWSIYHPRPQQGTSAGLGGASTKQPDKSFHDCVMLSKILLLLRTLVPPAKRNRNQTQIIVLHFCFLVFISSILFWQGYKGYPGPPGHPGDQVSFPTSQQGSFEEGWICWLWCCFGSGAACSVWTGSCSQGSWAHTHTQTQHPWHGGTRLPWSFYI